MPLRLCLIAAIAMLASALPTTSTARAQQPASTIEIHRYVALKDSYETNAYWLESGSGIVLIDALMLKKDAAHLAAAMKVTGKPLAAILLTHPHVDHFGGIRTIVDAFGGKVPVIATRATADAVKKVHDAAVATWAKDLGDRYEQNVFVPNRIVASGEALELAGIRLKIRDFGAMESDNNSIIEVPDLKAIFTGDATVNHAPFYVGEGHSAFALKQLESLTKEYPSATMAYAGHNEPGPLGYVASQNAKQVAFMRDLVTRALEDSSKTGPDGRLTREARMGVIQAIAAQFDREGLGSYGLNSLVIASLNLAGLEEELRAKPAGHP